MMIIRTAALTALLLLIQQSTAFVPVPTTESSNGVVFANRSRRTTTTQQMSKESGGDPTKVWYAGLADTVQTVLTSNSPLNEGKKALVRSLAGSYDREAIQAKLNGLIEERPVLMLSFRT